MSNNASPASRRRCKREAAATTLRPDIRPWADDSPRELFSSVYLSASSRRHLYSPPASLGRPRRGPLNALGVKLRRMGSMVIKRKIPDYENFSG